MARARLRASSRFPGSDRMCIRFRPFLSAIRRDTTPARLSCPDSAMDKILQFMNSLPIFLSENLERNVYRIPQYTWLSFGSLRPLPWFPAPPREAEGTSSQSSFLKPLSFRQYKFQKSARHHAGNPPGTSSFSLSFTPNSIPVKACRNRTIAVPPAPTVRPHPVHHLHHPAPSYQYNPLHLAAS